MIASLLLLVGLAHAVVVDRIAAVVNSDVITLSEVYALGGDFIEQRTLEDGGADAARRAAELEVLDSLIMRRLISQEVSGRSTQVWQAAPFLSSPSGSWLKQTGSFEQSFLVARALSTACSTLLLVA